MTERTFPRVVALALFGVAACNDLEAADDDLRVAQYEDLGVIDGGAASIDGSVPSSDELDSDADADLDAGAEDAGHSRPDPSVTIRDPNGAYFADVKANGTGCPAGTWSANISPDGQSFTLTFASFEAEVDRSRAVSVKDCNISLRLHSPEAMAFTVESFYFGGYMYLEPDIQLRVQANYYFQGRPDEGAQRVTDIVGPQDRSFAMQDAFEDVSVLRSRCGTESTLNTRLTVRLRNSNPRGNGYVNITLPSAARSALKLSWKRCNE